MQSFTLRFVGLIMLLILAACGGQSGPARLAATQPAGQDALLPTSDGAARPLDGVIQSINGDSLVIERLGDVAVTVTLDTATQLRRQMSVGVSDLAVGLEVTALIAEQDGGIKALLVQIGDQGAGMPLLTGGPGAPASGAGPATLPLGDAGPPAGGALARTVSGTILSRDAGTLTLRTPEAAELTLTLTAATQVQREEPVTRDALGVGQLVLVAGQRSGSSFIATSLLVLRAE